MCPGTHSMSSLGMPPEKPMLSGVVLVISELIKGATFQFFPKAHLKIYMPQNHLGILLKCCRFNVKLKISHF